MGVPCRTALVREENGDVWLLYAGARFYVPDMTTYDRVSVGWSTYGVWDGAVDHIPRAPVDGTLLREDNGDIWVIYGGAKFHVPDPDTFERMFDGRDAFQLWDGALDEIGTIPVDGTRLREEGSEQVYVVSGGRKRPADARAPATVVWRSALAKIPTRRAPADFDGDGRSDLVLYSPWLRTWNAWSILQRRQTAITWRVLVDDEVPLLGNFDGDERCDLVVYSKKTGIWRIWSSAAGAAMGTFQWARPSEGDIPLVGDFDGNGQDDLAMYRPAIGLCSMWSSQTQDSLGQLVIEPPIPDTVPLVGDFDGDGQSDLAVYDHSKGVWQLWSTATRLLIATVPLGRPGGDDVPLVGDFDGDGQTDLALYSPSTGSWQLWSTAARAALPTIQWRRARAGDIAVAADFDGDGVCDVGLYTPSTGIWRLRSSAEPDFVRIVRFGKPDDVLVVSGATS